MQAQVLTEESRFEAQVEQSTKCKQIVQTQGQCHLGRLDALLDALVREEARTDGRNRTA